MPAAAQTLPKARGCSRDDCWIERATDGKGRAELGHRETRTTRGKKHQHKAYDGPTRSYTWINILSSTLHVTSAYKPQNPGATSSA